MDGYEEELTPSERAREKRRDHEAAAAERSGMRTGLAKQFKQVMDVQRRRGDEAQQELERLRGEDEERERIRRKRK